MSTPQSPSPTQRDAQMMALDEALSENARFRDQIYYLSEMGRLLGQLDLELLLVRMLDLTTEFLGADVGSIVLYDSMGELETAVDWGLPHSVLMQLQRHDGRAVVEEAVQSGEPLHLRQADLRPLEDGSHRAENLFVLPLRTESQTLGCINMVAAAGERTLGREWLEVVRPGVGLAAIAVENAQLVQIKLAREREQQQLVVAQEIQRGLLPRAAPQVDGLELTADSVAAAVIGGDYFDYLHFEDGSLGVVVADVVGKGVPAGLVMAAVRAMFRTTSKQISSPAGILTQVNRQLCAEDLNAVFVTALCARVDAEASSLTIASAGHDPPMVLHRGEARLESPGTPCLPLGILADQAYQEHRLALQPEDAFVFYTDGVTEAMNRDDQPFGTRGLSRAAENCTATDARGLIKTILEDISRHIGTHPRHDDTTLVVGRFSHLPNAQ